MVEIFDFVKKINFFLARFACSVKVLKGAKKYEDSTLL